MIRVSWKWFARAGAVCLVVGSLAQLAQYLVTPLKTGDDAAALVARASEHLSAMGWALALDAPLLLIIPGILFVGWLAGAGEHRLAAAGTAVAFLGLLAAVFLLASDVLVYEAARLGSPGATKLVDAYMGNGLVIAMVAVYLVGEAVGFVLLAVSLWRRRVVPVWCCAALGVFPFLEFAGHESGVTIVAISAYALLVASLAVCAAALLEGRAVSRSSEPAVTPRPVDVTTA